MASEKGCTSSMYNLGRLYEKFENNIAEAKKWYLIAAEKKHR